MLHVTGTRMLCEFFCTVIYEAPYLHFKLNHRINGYGDGRIGYDAHTVLLIPYCTVHETLFIVYNGGVRVPCVMVVTCVLCHCVLKYIPVQLTMINVKFINNTLHLVYLYLCIRKLCLFTAGAAVSVTRFRYNVCFTVSKRNRLRLGWSAAVRLSCIAVCCFQWLFLFIVHVVNILGLSVSNVNVTPDST